jgi:hypothetical protein
MDILYLVIAAAVFAALAWLVIGLPDFETRREP